MVLAKIEHARQRRESELRNVLPQVKLGAHFEHRVLSGLQHETIRTAGARRIEQRVQTQFARLRVGALDPELGEPRKLLAGHQRSVDREAARRKPVALATTEGTEVARAEKHQHFVLVLRRIDRVVDAKPGVTEAVQRLGVERVGAIVEKLGVEAHVVHAIGCDFVQLHRVVVVQPLVEKHQLERQLRSAPPRAIRLEADVAILIVRQLLQFLRQRDVGFLVRSRSELAGARRDIVEPERRAGGGEEKCGERDREAAQRRPVRAPQKQIRPPKWRPKPPAHTDGPQYA